MKTNLAEYRATRFRDSCDRVGRGEEHVEEGMYDEDP